MGHNKLDRRSFLRQVGALTGLGSMSLVLGFDPVSAQQPHTDNDAGPKGDVPGHGRGAGQYSDRDFSDDVVIEGQPGVTDSDTGNYGDSPGQGRGWPRTSPTGISDQDQSDRFMHGRGTQPAPPPRQYRPTDTDTGRYGDPTGAGRGPALNFRTGTTDSDSGSNADRTGYGRGRAGSVDTDSGANADRFGGGTGRGTPTRARSGITDTDLGPAADEAFYGRGTTRRPDPQRGPGYTGCTDTDTSDRTEYGRVCGG